MSERIEILAGDVAVVAELDDTPTARGILQLLPIESRVNTWGDEVYFVIPLTLELEAGSRADVEVGELGYWPSGPAFCIFFGPTPASVAEKPRAASGVNVFGRVMGDPAVLRRVSAGAKVQVKRSS